MYSNKQSNRRTFYIYCYLLKNKSICYNDIYDKFEVSNRSFQTYIRKVKSAVELLKLPYIIRFNYKMQKYELIELPIDKMNRSYVLTDAQEKEVAMIKIYNYLKHGVKINLNTLYKLYGWDEKTAREFIRQIAFNLREVSDEYYIYYHPETKSFEYELIDNEDYYDSEYEEWLEKVYDFND